MVNHHVRYADTVVSSGFSGGLKLREFGLGFRILGFRDMGATGVGNGVFGSLGDPDPQLLRSAVFLGCYLRFPSHSPGPESGDTVTKPRVLNQPSHQVCFSVKMLAASGRSASVKRGPGGSPDETSPATNLRKHQEASKNLAHSGCLLSEDDA